jgi:acyl-coenzyme A thioesterase PaaI-like protein
VGLTGAPGAGGAAQAQSAGPAAAAHSAAHPAAHSAAHSAASRTDRSAATAAGRAAGPGPSAQPPATSFDKAIEARPLGAGRFAVHPDERFAIGDAVNGGVLVAAMLRAVLSESPHPYPVATSAHFLRVARREPAEVHVTWLKRGRTAATARASLIQDGLPVIEAIVTTGALGPGPHPGPGQADPGYPGPGQAGTGHVDSGQAGAAAGNISSSAAPDSEGGGRSGTRRSTAARSTGGTGSVGSAAGPDAPGGLSWTGEPPRLPPVEACRAFASADGFIGQVDIRFDPATMGWLDGHPDGTPEMRGYLSLREERDPDAYLLAVAVDALPPVVFGLGAVGWAPTVELTWHMRGVPVPGLLRVAARCRRVSAGWFDEEAEVWDAAGQLVAQSRQLARVGRPGRR